MPWKVGFEPVSLHLGHQSPRQCLKLSLMHQISIGQFVSVKYFHDKGVAWSQTKPSIPESTQMRIHTAAQSVIRH